MVNNLLRQRPVFFNVVFCILVGCLAAHFLVDGLLLQGLSMPGQSSDFAGFPNDAEFDHQDDQVILAEPPARIASASVPRDFELPFLLEKQPPSSIFHPPQN